MDGSKDRKRLLRTGKYTDAIKAGSFPLANGISFLGVL